MDYKYILWNIIILDIPVIYDILSALLVVTNKTFRATLMDRESVLSSTRYHHKKTIAYIGT